jgi:Ca2+-binding EF-hand superfamily protein
MSQPTAKDLIAEASEQRKRELYEPVLVRLFQTYDEDESGTLEANEIRQIMLDCIEDERKVLNEKEVSQFMRVIGGEELNTVNDEDLKITEENFVQFMMSGLIKTKKQLQKFAKRSPMHKKLYVFMKHLRDDSDALERAEYQRNESSYKWFISMLWRKYDADRSGAIDVEEMKALLVDAVVPTLEKQASNADSTGGNGGGGKGHLPSTDEVAAFMKSLDKDGNGSLDKEEFTKFVLESLQQSEEERMKFASRSPLHEKLYLFLHSVFDHESGPHKEMIDNAAATIIQRSFRRYLNKKHDADLLNVVKAAEEFNFDSLLEATIGEDMEGMNDDFDEDLEMSTGNKSTKNEYDDGDFDKMQDGDEPNWLNDSAKHLDAGNDDDEDDYDAEFNEIMGFDDDDDDADDENMTTTTSISSSSTKGANPKSPSSNEAKTSLPPSGFQEKEEVEAVVMFTDNGEVDLVEQKKKQERLKKISDNFVWNYIGATLSKKLSQIQDLFSQMDDSGDGLLSKEEFEKALEKLNIHLNPEELEVMFHRMEVNEKSHHSINFVQFHKSLHTAVRNMSLTRSEFEYCIRLLGIAVTRKDIFGIYQKLAHENKPDVAHNIFFDALQEEMYQLRNPLMRKILKKFFVKSQRILQRMDSMGQCSIVSFREKDVNILAKKKEHEQLAIVKRLQQALVKDPSKSARNTLGRILGTKKQETNSHDPVKWFVGDYVATILLSTGMRMTELFNHLDSSGDGFLTHDELTRALKKMDIGKTMTKAELHVLHDIVDQDGDGECSFKELRKRLEMAKDSRHITVRAFRDVMGELGFGELQEEQLENIYNAVNVEGDGRIYFEDLRTTLHKTDEHGIPLAAGGDMGDGFDGTIPLAGTHDDKDMVPEWLTGLQFGGNKTGFTHNKPKPGVDARKMPSSLRKVLKGHSLLTRRALLHLHQAGLMRITEMRKEHVKALNDLPEPKRLEILEALYEKLRAERSRGGKSHEVLAHLLKLDKHRKKIGKARKATTTTTGGKNANGTLDGHAFSRNYVLAVLRRRGKGRVKDIVAMFDNMSREGGEWQKKVRDALPGIKLQMNDVQMSLLRWVLEGMSWDLVKIGKAIKSLRPYGMIYDSQFHNALGLLGEYMDVEVTESLYVKLTSKDGDSRVDYMKLHRELFNQREQATRVGMKVLEHTEEGTNWVDDMDSLKKPLWLKVENEQEKQLRHKRKAARTGKWGDANTMAYERSQHGHAKFGGSVYGPRLVDTMDEFARASVKSGVNPRRINRLVAQHQHKHANSAKSSSNKKKSNRN